MLASKNLAGNGGAKFFLAYLRLIDLNSNSKNKEAEEE
jgi:hypothetical protein